MLFVGWSLALNHWTKFLQVQEQLQLCSRLCASHAVRNVQSRELTLRNATQQLKSYWLAHLLLLVCGISVKNLL